MEQSVDCSANSGCNTSQGLRFPDAFRPPTSVCSAMKRAPKQPKWCMLSSIRELPVSILVGAHAFWSSLWRVNAATPAVVCGKCGPWATAAGDPARFRLRCRFQQWQLAAVSGPATPKQIWLGATIACITTNTACGQRTGMPASLLIPCSAAALGRKRFSTRPPSRLSTQL